jgi:hypothetical protein
MLRIRQRKSLKTRGEHWQLTSYRIILIIRITSLSIKLSMNAIRIKCLNLPIIFLSKKLHQNFKIFSNQKKLRMWMMWVEIRLDLKEMTISSSYREKHHRNLLPIYILGNLWIQEKNSYRKFKNSKKELRCKKKLKLIDS